MKRYYLFPLFAGLAAVVLLTASFWVSPATASDQVYSASFELSVADFEKATTLHALPAAIAVRRADHVASWRSSVNASPILHPHYAESLKTDALIFVDTRLRC